MFPPQYADYSSEMFSEEMKTILYYVLTSWQVIGVTVAIILYLSLVGYVSRSNKRPRFVSRYRPRKTKKAAVALASSSPEEAPDSADTNEALGLEEE